MACLVVRLDSVVIQRIRAQIPTRLAERLVTRSETLLLL